MRLGKKGQRFVVADFETTGIEATSVPIEVGLIVCDENFAVLDTYSSLICWPVQQSTWPPEMLVPYRVHGITPADLVHGRDRKDVAGAISKLAEKHAAAGAKPVLVSDNIQFEWMHMAKLLDRPTQDVFHYCGWDTSLLLEATGVGDPYPVPHRALADAGLLHAAIVKALDRTRSLRD